MRFADGAASGGWRCLAFVAARQAQILFVPKKTVEQQDIQALHRARQTMVNHRTAVVSQIRGLLLDRGFAAFTRARRDPEISCLSVLSA
jgi:transposase